MKKLLSFYLPSLLPEAFKMLAAVIGVMLVIRLIPLEPLALEIFDYIIIILLFPLIIFFNKKLYPSYDLQWILLAPIKKTRIILANGSLNLLKLAVTVIGIFVLIRLFRTRGLSPLDGQIDDLLKWKSDTLTLYLSYWAIGVAFAVSIIFSLAGNYTERMRTQYDYKTHNNLKTNYKELLKFLYLLPAFFFLKFSGHVGVYFPPLLRMSALAVFIPLIGTLTTLNALNIYFSRMKVTLIFVSLFILTVVSFYSISKNNITNKKIDFYHKLAELKFLGVYAGELKLDAIKSLTEADDLNLSALREDDIKGYFGEEVDKEIMADVLINWERKCIQNKDYNCRLAAYLHGASKQEKMPLHLLKSGCPNDMHSCYNVLIHPDATKEDKKSSEDLLTTACTANISKDKVCCDCFKEYQDKNKFKEERKAKILKNKKIR